MKVSIVETENCGHDLHVLFATENGAGRACWAGDFPPTIGHTYDVECDVEVAIDFAKTASLNQKKEFGVNSLNAMTIFNGRIEGQDDDGMCYLRVFNDCLIMIESLQNGIEGEWLTITAPIELVRVTPIGT